MNEPKGKLCLQVVAMPVETNPSRGIFGVLGPNGAGKTTFLAMLMGLIKPTSGDISIFEKSLKYCKYEILKEINFQSPYVELC